MTDIIPAALSDLRVLDLTDLKGALCAKLLGDMGTDVIKIEPPGGDPVRAIGLTSVCTGPRTMWACATRMTSLVSGRRILTFSTNGWVRESSR